jgi:outer membrane immunogenic protein
MTSAGAADFAAPAAYNWTGPYVGIQAGYAFGSSDIEDTTLGTLGEVDPEGFFGGLHLGYNLQTGSNFVLGLEGDINLSDVDGTDSTIQGGAASDVHDGESDWNGSARLRAGFAMDRALIYATGGVAIADYDITMVYFDGPNNDSATMIGWTVGAGVEFAVSSNLTTRVEARYSDYGSFSDTFDGFPLENVKADLKTTDVRVGLSLRF